MFRNATSYLWGTSDANKKKKKQHASANSLPDISNLHFDEKQNGVTIANHSKSIQPISYSFFTNPPKDIILNKNSKFKMSGTQSIKFLYDNNNHNNTDNNNNNNNSTINTSPPPIPLSAPPPPPLAPPQHRYPYYITSNRNVRYINIDKANDIDIPVDEKIENNEEKSSNPIATNTTSTSTSGYQNDLILYLDSLNLTSDEKKGILDLFKFVSTQKLSPKLFNDLWISEIIITWFSSLSPTNPDMYGCYKRWITYRIDHSLYNLSTSKLKLFYDSGIYSIGFDKNRRPVWFINTDKYIDYNLDILGPDIITHATILWLASLLFDINKNEFDLFALRRGLSMYCNLSHWSINMASWTIVKAIKAALIAYPFHLVDIFVCNIPTFIYIIKQIAQKIIVPHAMNKFKIISDDNEYFQKYADKTHTPICAGGTLKVSATQWMIDRGYLDYIEPLNKHKKSPSSII